MISCSGVGGAPHETVSCCLFWHVPLRAWSQESPGEASQGVRPGRGGAVDRAAIDPCCHQIHLQVFCEEMQGHKIWRNLRKCCSSQATVHIYCGCILVITLTNISLTNWHLCARVTGTLAGLFVPWSSLEGQQDFSSGSGVKDRVTFWDWDVHELRRTPRSSWVEDFKSNMITWEVQVIKSN